MVIIGSEKGLKPIAVDAETQKEFEIDGKFLEYLHKRHPMSNISLQDLSPEMSVGIIGDGTRFLVDWSGWKIVPFKSDAFGLAGSDLHSNDRLNTAPMDPDHRVAVWNGMSEGQRNDFRILFPDANGLRGFVLPNPDKATLESLEYRSTKTLGPLLFLGLQTYEGFPLFRVIRLDTGKEVYSEDSTGQGSRGASTKFAFFIFEAADGGERVVMVKQNYGSPAEVTQIYGPIP
jgi:hypothetical protein